MNTSLNSLDPLKRDIESFDNTYSSKFADLIFFADKLSRACGILEQAWSGSFVGWHGRMYFQDFEKPSIHQRFNGEWGGIHGIPDGWEEKDAKQVSQKISEIIGNDFDVDKFQDSIKVIRSSIEDLKSSVNTVLSVADLSKNPKDDDVAKKIEEFTFGEPKIDYVNNHLPKTLWTRDTEALRQGTCIPSHLYYQGVAYEAEETVKSYKEYKKLVDRLIKQVEMRSNTNPEPASPSSKLYGIHADIVTKCSSLWDSGAYAEAVEKSFKIVRDRLRTVTGHETGSEAFGKGKLHIKGAAAQNVDSDFNQASKFLMMAIDMFRNEKSHTSDAKIVDPIRAFQYLTMSSLALGLLDNSEILP